MIAFDTETNGVDFWHGCRPFMVTTCDEEGNQLYWEWEVDPFTREVSIPPEDVEEILEVLTKVDHVVGQNIRFDVHAMSMVDPRFAEWDWSKTDDTLIESHLLGSNELKDLTTLALRWLDIDLSLYEKRLGDAVKKARNIVKRKDFIAEYGQWKIASEENEDLPSATGESPWRNDYWLPKELWKRVPFVQEEHPEWEHVLRDYALSDTGILPHLFLVMRAETEARGMLAQYKSRMAILPVLWQMERDGVTVIDRNLDYLQEKYLKTQMERGSQCLSIAKARGYDLELPKGASPNSSLRSFVFDVLQAPQIIPKKSKSGSPSLNKEVLAQYLETMPEEGDLHRFVTSLLRKRKVDTALSYIESYKRYALPIRNVKGIVLLHPSINPVGTTVTRRSSSNPNEQNISKLKDDEELSLRFGFGPDPDGEWWSMDYENLELRIPAYEAEEQAMIDLFENPDAAPYFGSNHLLCAHILWSNEFEECLRKGESFKDKYKSTLYQWTKNGNFAVQYGAQEQSGTADRAYHQVGAHAKIQKRLGKINDLNRAMIAHANQYGFVFTMPDKTVDLSCGYPVQCTRTERGNILPTVPLSYHVQGTAGWVTGKALIRCSAQLEEWNREAGRRQYWLVMEVHDELVFRLPKGGRKNLGKVAKLKYLMELSGKDIGVPLKVDVSYHPLNWAEEVKL